MDQAEISSQTEDVPGAFAHDRERGLVDKRILVARVTHAFIAFGIAAALFLALRIEPDPRGLGTHQQLYLLPCNFYALTGLPCPFCGMTTSFAHMVRGEFSEAFFAQPMGVLGFTICLLFLPIAIGAAISGKNTVGALAGLPWERFSWLLGGAILVSWLFKLAIVIMK